jgi:hypothetical protein
MKVRFFLSVLFLTVVSLVFVPRVEASPPNPSESREDNLAEQIAHYRWDAFLCAASPIIATIPESSHILVASKCLLSAGVGVTEIIRSLTECAHSRHTKDSEKDRNVLGCFKAGSAYFAGNKEALACLAGSGLEKSGKEVLKKLGLVGNIVTCSLTVVQGVSLLKDATSAANKARKEARESADTLARLISSLNRSRIYNMGYYRGCLAVTKVFRNYDDEAKEAKCVSLCDSTKFQGFGALAGTLNEKQQAYTSLACKAGCHAFEAVENSWAYTILVSSEPGQRRQGCELLVAKVRDTLEGKTQVNFRALPLPGTNSGTESERLGAYLAWKIRINAALDAIERNWDNLKPQDGLVKVDDLVAFGNRNDDDAMLISTVFGNRDLGTFYQGNVPILAALLDSTQTSDVDGLVSLGDVNAFRHEINSYYF